ncbi:nosL-related protein [hydrothermal vent metagenome]|uniref:NosL-related protein n=1 Tax=hydrothermal vent metagenome TaxID=652676 RepID=A0A1W1EKV4_9ZZZZ
MVRKLAIYKEPKWASKIELINGKKIFFSSPKSMFEFYYRPGKWFDIGVKSEEDFKDIIVTDYITMKPINAREAFYIYGTNVISPAGDDLVAIDGEYNAKEFSLKHNGKRVLRFNEVSDALIRLLNGRI